MQLWVQRLAGKKWALDVPEHILEVLRHIPGTTAMIVAQLQSNQVVAAVLTSTHHGWVSWCMGAVQITQLRSLVAAAGGLPADRLKLLVNGKVLQDGNSAKWLKENGAFLTCTDQASDALEHLWHCTAVHCRPQTVFT